MSQLHHLRKLATGLASASFIFFGLAMTSGVAHGATINITPATPGIIGANLGPSNCEVGCVYDAFGLTNDGTLSLFYKADVGNQANPATVYSGTFANSYTTTFSNTEFDPANALIEYVLGEASIACPECYMAIKDGNQNPSYYFIDLGNLDLDGASSDPAFAWNGLDSLNLTGFWPGGGAISHVSIWGRAAANGNGNGGANGNGNGGANGNGNGGSVPEPATLALVGLGLLGAAVARRRQRS